MDLVYTNTDCIVSSNFLILGALMQTFEGESLIAAEKVVGSWLANAKWRQQNDGTCVQKLPNLIINMTIDSHDD